MQISAFIAINYVQKSLKIKSCAVYDEISLSIDAEMIIVEVLGFEGI
jgi:hypothetical protein